MKFTFKNGDIVEGTAQEIADLLSRIKDAPAPVNSLLRLRKWTGKPPLDLPTKKFCQFIATTNKREVNGHDLAPIIGAQGPSGVGPMLRTIRRQLEERGINLDDIFLRHDQAPGGIATWSPSPNSKLQQLVDEEASQ